MARMVVKGLKHSGMYGQYVGTDLIANTAQNMICSDSYRILYGAMKGED